MECRQPGAVREEELLAYLAGESVRPAVVQHIASCEHCAAQLAAYRRLELALTSTLYRWDCPSNEVLGEYQLGLLSSEIATAVKMHLGMCVLCAAEVAALTEFLANDPLLVERTPAPSISVSPVARNHRGSAHAQDVRHMLDQVRDRASAGARRIVAVLLPPQPRLAYQREMMQVETSWPRRYTAEDFSISIQVERGSQRRDVVQLIGFVTRKGASLDALQGTPVRLSSSSEPVQMQTIDELGNFIFASVVPAAYTLELQFPEGTVQIDQFQVALQD
ncbi:MAG: hypothetical protein M3Z08_18155 [Chloroflexota bacterium]|nr:hypothetical protein [Chloroflexota bacterium]